MSIEPNKNNIIVYNFFYIFQDQKQMELSPSSTFKPNQNNFIKTTSVILAKEGPENKIIINNENNMNDVNYELIKDKINMEENNDLLSLEKTKDITIEISNEEMPKFISKKQFFNVDIRKRTGRKKTSSIKRSPHTKYCHDNILRKIKVKFFNKLVKYINNIISKKYKAKIKVLVPLKGDISQNNSIKFNTILLNSKLKDIFSNFEISGKYKLFEHSYNRKVIQKIYEENIQELIEIFEFPFLEVFNYFKGINESHVLNGMEKIYTVIDEIRMKEKNDDYINEFRKVAMDFENYYLKK